MPSRSEGWGGLFKDDQYRLIKVRFANIARSALRTGFEQTAPPSLREGTPPNLGGEYVELRSFSNPRLHTLQ